MNPEGTTDESDETGLPDEESEDDEDDAECSPADIFRSRREDLGDNIQQR